MNRTERSLLVATAVMVVVGGGVWVWRRHDAQDVVVTAGGGDRPAGSTGSTRTAPVIDLGPGEGPTATGGGAMGPGSLGGRAPSHLREPTGEDLSDPARVNALLREHLSAENPRWDWIAQLVAVAPTLDASVKASLEEELVHGNAAGALQAFGRVRDPSLTPDLLKTLDDPSIDAQDRRAILEALATMPGADASDVVTGIEGRLRNDYAHDLPYLQAIARRGGPEAARSLVEAIARSSTPDAFTEETWRDLDLRRDTPAAEAIAKGLADRSLPPETLRAIAALAGKPGAAPVLVDALLALEASESKDVLRREVIQSLARTGDEKAMGHLVELASSSGADYASVAAAAIGRTSSASTASRTLLLDAAKKTTDDNLRTQIVSALGNVRDDKSVPTLSDWVASGSDAVQKASVVALGRIGPAAGDAVPALVKAFQTGDETMKNHVAIALGSIGTSDALAALQQLNVAGVSPSVRTAIGNAVQRIRSQTR